MNDFEIRRQVQLPATRCVELVVSGLRFRLFRAMVTVSIVALAVAFLMTIVGSGFIGREVTESLQSLTAPRRALLFWIHRLSAPLSEGDLLQTLRRAQPGDARWEEFKTWGRGDDAALERLRELAVAEDPYRRFFADLGEGKRRAVAGRARGRDIFARLVDPGALGAFFDTLPELGVPLPGSEEAFRDFVAGFEQTRPLRDAIRDGHARALETVRQRFEGLAASALLVSMDAERDAFLRSIGFRLPAADALTRLSRDAAMTLDAQRLERLLRNMVLKQRFATRFGVKHVSDVNTDMLFSQLSSAGGARWLLSLEGDMGEAVGMDAERIVAVAREQLAQRRLSDLEAATAPLREGEGWFGFSSRVLWLIGVSLLVCMVGIANAMLMSVSERFQEIATMKCLGATDGFIMLNFILESGFQGLAGGVLGGLLGLLLAVVRAAAQYGTIAFQNIPLGGLGAIFSLCLVVGVGLSIVAAIYPAWVAARLAPMEAMRVE